MDRELVVVKQPDGLYAIWSRSSEDFVVFDATPDDIDTYIVNEAIKKAQQTAMEYIANAHRNEKEIDFFGKLKTAPAPTGSTSDPLEMEYHSWHMKWSNYDEAL